MEPGDRGAVLSGVAPRGAGGPRGVAWPATGGGTRGTAAAEAPAAAGADRGARRLGLLALAGGIASLVALAVLWSPVDTNRAYFGTDSRLGPTLLGAALATVVARRARRSRPPSTALDLAALVALGGLAAAFLVIDGQGAAYYRGGLVAFTLAVLVIIVAVTGGPPGRAARALSWRPLVALGAISYGVYLWHWPVIVYLTPDRLGVRRFVAQARVRGGDAGPGDRLVPSRRAADTARCPARADRRAGHGRVGGRRARGRGRHDPRPVRPGRWHRCRPRCGGAGRQPAVPVPARRGARGRHAPPARGGQRSHLPRPRAGRRGRAVRRSLRRGDVVGDGLPAGADRHAGQVPGRPHRRARAVSGDPA